MSTLSGLQDTTREYVGHSLAIRFEGGWGWTINTETDCFSYDGEDAVNGTYAEVVPSSFFAHEAASTRGFVGRIIGSGHPLHDQPVLAYTMSDGFDYDFSTNICNTWRFWIGEGELVCPPDSFPRLHGARIIGGYGCVAACKADILRS